VGPDHFLIFFNKNLFARCKYMHFSTGQYKIVPGQPIYLQNTRCARGHGATTSGDGRYSSEKMGTKEKNTAAEGYEIRGECIWVVYVDMGPDYNCLRMQREVKVNSATTDSGT
jgi:hypothetical protein